MKTMKTLISMLMMTGLALAMLIPVAVQASCEQGDLTGVWMTYGISIDTYFSNSDETDRCKIKVNSSGTIVATASYCIFRDQKGKYRVDVAGGSVLVASNCRVTGTVDLCYLDACSFGLTIEHGTLSQDKNVISMLGYSRNDNDVVFSFTGVKR